MEATCFSCNEKSGKNAVPLGKLGKRRLAEMRFDQRPEPPSLGGSRRVREDEVSAGQFLLLPVKAEDIRHGDVVDDLTQHEAEDLPFQDMPEPLLGVGEGDFELFAAVQPLDDLRDVESRLHVEIDEGLFRVVKNAGILLCKRIDHAPDDGARREDLVRLLRQDVIENVFVMALIEVVAEPLLLVEEILDGIVEYDFVEQMSVEMTIFSRRLIQVVAAVS